MTTERTWHCGKGHDSTWPDTICEGPHAVARVLGGGYPLGRGWSQESEDAANLIAAAPKLLALARWAMTVLDVNPRDRPRGVLECDLIKARLDIKAATGHLTP